METNTNPTRKMTLPFDTPEYWDNLARNERAFADEDRRRRTAPVESIQIHLRNAEEYEARAAAIRGAREGK